MHAEPTSLEPGAGASHASATYVYCVVARERPPRLGGAPKGLRGTGRPRVLDAGGGYHLIVTSAPPALYDATVIDQRLGDLGWVAGRANEHERVVEHVTSLGTVLPMKLFTLFSSDERAVEHVRTMKRALDRIVRRIAGCEEWGLRILYAPERAARAHRRPVSAASGTSFLRQKKAVDDERRRAGARRAATIEELYERLGTYAREAHRRAAPAERETGVALDSVFLVPRESVKGLKSTLAAWARSVADEGYEVNLSGPWPAYSFTGGR